MEENHFLNGERNVTPTDVKLAQCYYPLLCEIAKGQKVMTFKEFVELAKRRYPSSEEVQNAIPVSTGRRLEFVRTYTKGNGLPDLSAWVVSQAGTNSEAYNADFNPVEEREETTKVNWDDYEGDWGEYVEKLTKATIKVKRIKEKDALKLMGEHFLKVKDRIPNPKKLPLVEVAKHFRAGVIEGLMEGKEVEEVFNDVIFDMTESRSASEVA